MERTEMTILAKEVLRMRRLQNCSRLIVWPPNLTDMKMFLQQRSRKVRKKAMEMRQLTSTRILITFGSELTVYENSKNTPEVIATAIRQKQLAPKQQMIPLRYRQGACICLIMKKALSPFQYSQPTVSSMALSSSTKTTSVNLYNRLSLLLVRASAPPSLPTWNSTMEKKMCMMKKVRKMMFMRLMRILRRRLRWYSVTSSLPFSRLSPRQLLMVQTSRTAVAMQPTIYAARSQQPLQSMKGTAQF